MDWRDGKTIERVLSQTFDEIGKQKMQGLSFVNPALTVQALGFAERQAGWLGVLITPWAMNLLLLAKQDSDWRNLAVGAKFECAFPYGCFEFTLAEHVDLGRYGQCSLFSNMFEFQGQAAAVAAAEAAAKQLFAVESAKSISRRNLLRGAFSQGA